MISDTLFECVCEIRQYLESEVYSDIYTGKMRSRIETLVAEAEAIRVLLDTPPSVLLPDESS